MWPILWAEMWILAKQISAHQKPHMGVQTVLLSFCSVVIFLSALQSDNDSNKVYVPRHKHVLGSSQSQLNPGLMALNKMTLIWPKTYIFFP